MLCVPELLSSDHEMDCLREETVLVPGRSGAIITYSILNYALNQQLSTET